MPDAPISTTGLLTVRVFCGRGLSVSGGESIPPLVQQALSTEQAKVASSVTMQSVRQCRRLAQNSEKRESLQRKQYWWLPYIILEFDKDEVLIGSVGDIDNNELGRSDLFMGNLKFVPNFDQRVTVDQWYDITEGSGQINVAVTFKASTPIQSLSVDSFDLLGTIGRGPYGHVMKVRKRDTSRIYAINTIRKAHLAVRSEITWHTLLERTVLAKVSSPFIVPLKFSFQTPDKLYLLLPVSTKTAVGEVLLESLHPPYGISREFEPENILLDYTGHIALCNVALCKFKKPDEDPANTFYGALDYMAPEVLLGHEYSKAADWWILGVFLYEMLTGLPPSYDDNRYEMYRKTLQDPLRFGDEVGLDARSLLAALLTREPSQRLGVNGAEEVKRHPFFSRYIDFDKLLAKKIQPPVGGALHTSHFSQVFTS
ncbi:hypothetical protein FRC00_005691 [Tulasnella sp. 408]|nr:hypothetical protein FRC00_005691 [Tulasnella sp. 408]